MTQTASSPQRRSVSQQWLVNLLDKYLAEHGDGALNVVDLGGGAGALAVHLATQGHQVALIDPSPDQLSHTDRRAQELGVADLVRTVQGDTATLTQQIPADSADVVLCHHVLYDVADRSGTMAAIHQVLRPGGVVSVLLKQSYQHLMRHVVDGDLASARALLADSDWLNRVQLTELLEAAGFTVFAEHGIGAVADTVQTDVDPEELLALEEQVAQRPEWLDAAASLHVLARRVE